MLFKRMQKRKNIADRKPVEPFGEDFVVAMRESSNLADDVDE